ncbi:MAG: hypothetical protein ACOY3L_11235 [Pseudomonadota bacterium]
MADAFHRSRLFEAPTSRRAGKTAKRLRPHPTDITVGSPGRSPRSGKKSILRIDLGKSTAATPIAQQHGPARTNRRSTRGSASSC